MAVVHIQQDVEQHYIASRNQVALALADTPVQHGLGFVVRECRWRSLLGLGIELGIVCRDGGARRHQGKNQNYC